MRFHRNKEKKMKQRLFVFLIIILAVFSCSKDTNDGKNKQNGNTKKVARITRKHIKKLDVKNFIELSLDYAKERRKWNMEWRSFMKKKVTQYFESFGLSESKFNNFAQHNQKGISDFVKKHPRYSRMLQNMQSQY